ncbi:glycosyltransferase family 2 protein [Actinospica durhamensis]|uniref:Glycosyltransferase family 2 protein n=1 Tax=Actinospica durhamensis TaxID=1508375 RepID=A0A941EPX5_9ACTN|nr:glycosyltransferase family 2 protein [Actinospica durhamensis]MBR7835216.1 glycosyltransferase family 2 protein [Actinospica durhamensis]
MNAARIEIVVVTWNSASVLGGLLDSLPAGLGGQNYHLTVVDNDSADETVALTEGWLREHPDVDGGVLPTGGNLGYAAAINAALRQAEPYTSALILNPDVRLEPGTVRPMLDLLEAPGEPGAPATGIVVPCMYSTQGELAYSLRREPSIPRAFGEAVLGGRAGRVSWLGESVLDPAAYRASTTVDWATGAILLISARCLEQCGPWDESFFLYSEETEFALRARDNGFATRLAPEAKATHIGGDSHTSARLWALLSVNRVRLYRRRHPWPATALYWCAVLLREAPRAALGRRTSRAAVTALLRLRPVNVP